MSDDLVKRYDLQQPTHHMGSAELVCDTYGDWVLYRDYKALADRNEELEALRDALTNKIHKLVFLLDDQLGTPCEQIRHQQQVEELERKLAKAVGRLEQMRDDRTGYRHPSHYIRGAAVTLAELKGETDA